jgi:hypothetical protein
LISIKDRCVVRATSFSAAFGSSAYPAAQLCCLRQRAYRAEYGCKALDHGRAWYRNLSLFEGDDRKPCKGFE